MTVALTRRFPTLSAKAETNINRSSAGMRSNWALPRCSGAELRANIAKEMRKTVIEAAEPAVPGEGVKQALLRAHRNLGRPKFWRVRAAWKGEAGDWSAHAVEDFRERIDALRKQRLRRERQEASELGQRIASLRVALAEVDPDFFGPTCDDLGRVLELAGGREVSTGEEDGA